MFAVMKLRLLGLKEDYKIMLVMAALALGMVYAFSAQGGQNSERTVYFTGSTDSPIVAEFIGALDRNMGYHVEEVDGKAGRDHLENGDGLAYIVVADTFESQIRLGIPELTFIAVKNDVDTMSLKRTIESILSRQYENWRFAEETAAQVLKDSGTDQNEVLAAEIYATLSERTRYESIYEVQSTSLEGQWSQESLNLRNFLGFSLLFSAYTIVFGAGEILNDKANHTWDRLIQSPVRKVEILAGNLVTTVIIGFIQLFIIFVGGQLLFGIDFGNKLFPALVVGFGYIFALTGLGLLLASTLKNHAQLSAVTPIILTSFAMLGGCMWPLEIVSSKILLGLSLITPHRWALEALEALALNGKSLADVQMQLGILLFMGILCVGIGSIKLKSTAEHT